MNVQLQLMKTDRSVKPDTEHQMDIEGNIVNEN